MVIKLSWWKMEQLLTPKVCDICGAEEPLPWFEMEMNEEIRAYARAYITPPITYHYTLAEALDACGVDWRSWELMEDYTGDSRRIPQ